MHLAAKYKKTAPQIFFNFIKSQGIVFLTGTTSEAHMTEDLASLSFTLEDVEIDAIKNLLK